MVFGVLREKSMNVSVVSRGMLETEHCLQEREKEREKVRVGPGLRECEAGYETNNCVELRVRWRGLYA